MSRGLWLATGAAVGLGAIVLATRSARASTMARTVVSSKGGEPVAAVERPTVSRPQSRLSPLLRSRVSPNGAFRAVRTQGNGQCRSGYPCIHFGVDLVPPSYYRGPLIEEEFWVRAPEDLVADFVARDDTSPPLSGYGPTAVLARGHSGAWHVFGHLSPRSLGVLKKGDEIRAGHFFARLASGVRPPHVHWELRRWRTKASATRELGRKVTRGDIVIDPDAWLRMAA